MLSQLWHNLAWSYRQGLLHEWFLKDGITLATWGLAVVTLLLVVDSYRKSQEQRERWEHEDEQRTADREEEQRRWGRDEQFRRLEWLDSQFNSPSMLAARRGMAREMMEGKASSLLGKPTPPIRPVIGFLTQVGAWCRVGLLDIRAVDFAYRSHVMVVSQVYGRSLQDSVPDGTLRDLQWLTEELSKAPSSAAIDSTLAASIPIVQHDFLEREAAL
jgi:hypothetical protein